MANREREIEVLLNAPYLLLLPAPGSEDFKWPNLGHDSKNKLRELLKRAMYLTNALSDMEARAIIETGQVSWAYLCKPKDLVESRGTLPYNPQKVLKKRQIPLFTRALQNEFLMSLHVDDLKILYTLLRMVSESWQVHNMTNRRIMQTMTPEERFLLDSAFREGVLRHGTWFLYGEVRGFGYRAIHHKALKERLVQEFRITTPRAFMAQAPKLLATMQSRLAEHFEVQVRDLDYVVLRDIEARIGAPVGVAFKNPASGFGRGSAAL